MSEYGYDYEFVSLEDEIELKKRAIGYDQEHVFACAMSATMTKKKMVSNQRLYSIILHKSKDKPSYFLKMRFTEKYESFWLAG